MTPSDVKIAQKYIGKCHHAKDAGHGFSITFNSFKRMRLSKRCALSGLSMDVTQSTIDRIDNSKGYIPGNVAGVRTDINSLKGTIEQLIKNTEDVNWKVIQRMVNNTVKLMENKGT